MTALPWDRFDDSSDDELPYRPPAPPPSPPPPAAPTSAPDPEPPRGVWVTQVGAGGGGTAMPSSPPPRHAAPDAEGDFNLNQLAHDAFTTALNAALPGVKSNAMDLLKAGIQATAKGQQIDWTHPTVIATTDRGQELVVADAKSRSWRTFLQGLGIDLLFGLIAALATLTGMDPLVKDTWILFGALVVKTIIQTVVSYVMRLKITPTIKEDGERYHLLPVPSAQPVKQDRAA